ncbi:transcriptional regulator [Clostridium cochlearium]|uniref:Transcriptional regulator n=1 Tax=Clostridium cochlearium TaxID=1494 RepID=A0A7Y3XXY0_CLOCO|nr:transcriptional regulator [Bacteroidales bacterium MSK.15.36]NME94761.1 transcriptional regulator [Clostridium cochlearium]NOH15500.1 transcriptional regulator [Clostridium cochlearium]NSJ92218.1 transcriptional regulator [Coprococcus sp. MSK.21.13]
MSKTKNDDAWEKLFEKYRIIEKINKEGKFEITSAQINEFREARLMTKFDHKNNLPKLFSKNKFSILPITRGRYVISRFEAYKNFEDINSKITKISFPNYIESIDYKNITSEAMAINCAYVSGIISDFLEDKKIVPTVTGRMSSSSFEFLINNVEFNKKIPLKVMNSQVEIDGGFEGKYALALLEAKNSISEDFLIRQLYYPFRLWNKKVSKEVKPIFMTYSNDVFSFYEYKFTNEFEYNSLRLLKQKNYIINKEDILLEDILEILNSVAIVKEPKVPFPQADNFKRVINLCELLTKNNMTKDQITLNYDFDPRQADYYVNAGIYLGLICRKKEKNKSIYTISNLGKNIMKQNYRTRQLSFAKLILEHKVFNYTLKLYFKKCDFPSKTEVVNIMKDSNMLNIKSEETFRRRASSIIGWINWILNLSK